LRDVLVNTLHVDDGERERDGGEQDPHDVEDVGLLVADDEEAVADLVVVELLGVRADQGHAQVENDGGEPDHEDAEQNAGVAARAV